MSNNDLKVKILISYHKPSILLKDDVLTPIHVGRALATEASKDGSMSEEDYKWMLDNMIGDDTGDNISDQNRIFNEITSVYWAWKNYDKLGNPDYIGFMHYRRHLNFNIDKIYEEDQWGLISNEYLDDNYINNYHLKSEYIKKIVQNYDILVAKQWDVRNAGSENNYDHYKKNHIAISSYEKILSILENKYPSYKEDIDNYNKSYLGYYTNMFVMKKEIFFEFCALFFTVLFEAQKTIDVLNSNLDEMRAYYSERLFSIYLYNKLRTSNIKFKEVQVTLVNNLDVISELYPKFNNSITICFSSDNNYAPYLAVAVYSLVHNSSNNNFYEIYIIADNISLENKSKILQMFNNNDNIIIKFINIYPYLKNIDKNIFHIDGHFTISTYYRFFIPRIFNNFNKILYLDSDIIILDDVEKLFNTKTDKMMSACNDIEMIRCIFQERYEKGFWTDYLSNKLKLDNPYLYFQAGVLLLDIQKIKKFNFEQRAIDKLKELVKPTYVDQCVLNSLCKGNINFLDLFWNVEWNIPIYHNNIISKLPLKYYNQYMIAYNNPKILHYAGYQKPWTHPHYAKSYIWWEYARKTPFYEEIIYKNTNINTINNVSNIKNITDRRFSIADFIFSIFNNESLTEFTILGIKIKLKKKILIDSNEYECFTDNTTRQDKTRQDIIRYYAYFLIIFYIYNYIKYFYKYKKRLILSLK